MRGGQTITMAYDALNRETTHAFLGAFPRTVTTNYDLASRKYDVALPDQTIKHRYDPAARLDFVDDTYLGATNYRTDYGYDPAGNRMSMTYPGGGTLTYSFDALNQMKTVGESGGLATLVEYDWDTLSRRERARVNNYTFQGSYGYEDDDDLDSLVHTGPKPLTFTILRNNVSQITSLTASDGTFLAKPALTRADAYSPNHLNQYTQVGGVGVSQDLNGNVTGDGTYAFEYDVENRLMTAVGAGNTASYQYDPIGRRRAKIVNNVTTKYASDGAEEIEERDASNAVLRKYAYGPSIDDRIAMKDVGLCDGNNDWCFYLTNWQGSATTLVHQNGNLKDTYHYGPYGEGTNWTPLDAHTGNPFRYTGRRVDPETGLYYYRARYYSPKWGRFLQTDPIGTKDDVNLYAYVYNDATNRVDPDGLCGSNIGGNSAGNCVIIQVNPATSQAATTSERQRVLIAQAIPITTPLTTIGSRGTGGVETVVRAGTEASQSATPKPAQDLGRAIHQILRQSQEEAAKRPGSPEALVPRKGESVQQYKDRLNDLHRRQIESYKPTIQQPTRPPTPYQSKWKELIDALAEWFGGTGVVAIDACAQDADLCTARQLNRNREEHGATSEKNGAAPSEESAEKLGEDPNV